MQRINWSHIRRIHNFLEIMVLRRRCVRIWSPATMNVGSDCTYLQEEEFIRRSGIFRCLDVPWFGLHSGQRIFLSDKAEWELHWSFSFTRITGSILTNRRLRRYQISERALGRYTFIFTFGWQPGKVVAIEAHPSASKCLKTLPMELFHNDRMSIYITDDSGCYIEDARGYNLIGLVLFRGQVYRSRGKQLIKFVESVVLIILISKWIWKGQNGQQLTEPKIS
jgi:hypothetical protein